MKAKLLLITIIIMIFLSSCTEEITYCDICGRESATQTMSGPAEILKESGIDLGKCRNITGNIYSINLCDTCHDKLNIIEAPRDPILEANGFYD